MDDEEIFDKICRGICDFEEMDIDLLDKNASERSISHKLAEHIQRYFPNHNVDCEYNRNEGDIKKLRSKLNVGVNLEPDDLDAKAVFPDIIIHKRGKKVNLAVIEVKKEKHVVEKDSNSWNLDKKKLESFTKENGDYKYKLGLFLIAYTKDKKLIINNVFEGGEDCTGQLDKIGELDRCKKYLKLEAESLWIR